MVCVRACEEHCSVRCMVFWQSLEFSLSACLVFCPHSTLSVFGTLNSGSSDLRTVGLLPLYCGIKIFCELGCLLGSLVYYFLPEITALDTICIQGLKMPSSFIFFWLEF